MNQLIRINKYISDSGICSRRGADIFISSGKVFVNDNLAEMGMKIDPSTDKVVCDGQIISSKHKHIYYALYKPRGIVSSASDEFERKNVIELVPADPRVYPVGRLDKNSEGLIILTNDGELTNILTHPKNMHEKEYEVRARTKENDLNTNNIEKNLTKGLKINNVLMKADKATARKIPNSDNIVINLILHTGYNRQIRKMFDKIGLDIIKLKRTRVGKLRLSDLKIEPGEYKLVKSSEIL